MPRPRGVDLRVDGTEVQVRRPRAGRAGRKAFVSGKKKQSTAKKKQSTAKTTTVSDSSGRLLWSGTDRPGPMRDQTAVRAEGIAEQFRLHPKVKAEADEGYRRLANEFPDQSVPRRRNRRMTPRSASGMPGAGSADANPPAGSAWSMSSEKRRSGARCSGTPDGTSTNPRPTTPSPAWSPTAPPADRPGTGRAPNWCSSSARPDDHHQTIHQASTSRPQSRTKS
ncbi:transposase family protein [Streptomyces sp. OK228]|uniref:transposase family protein n=1 Tax=Streptomyces sp. OK228 TaxID=1882786 RepID=UPI0027BA230D|nr:transposase family protein [Streptomyces sp. OK228]